MIKENQDHPAFPISYEINIPPSAANQFLTVESSFETYPGLSKLEWLVGQVLPSMLARHTTQSIAMTEAVSCAKDCLRILERLREEKK